MTPPTPCGLWLLHGIVLPSPPQPSCSTVELILGSLPPLQAHAAHVLTHAEALRSKTRREAARHLPGTGQQLAPPHRRLTRDTEVALRSHATSFNLPER